MGIEVRRPSRRSFTIALITGLVLVAASALALAGVSLNVIVFALVLGVAVALRDPLRILVLAASMVPFVGFARRVLAGEDGRLEFDILATLPIATLLVALAFALANVRGRPRLGVVAGIAAVVCVSVPLALLITQTFQLEALYFAAMILVPLLAALLVMVGWMTDPWPAIQKMIPFAALLVGLYGIVQFYFLPSWDSAWMKSSGMDSIGVPHPLQVRVFGMSESPGPYAAFVGLAVVIALARATSSSSRQRWLWFALAVGLVAPLLLSGVRVVFVAIGLCAIALAVFKSRGWMRLLPILLLAVGGVTINLLVVAFGENSSILNSERLSSLDLATDPSVQARLGLLRYVWDVGSHLVGAPGSDHVDNWILDMLVSYGIVAAVGALAMTVAVAIVSARTVVFGSVANTAPIAALYFLVLSLSGNPFLSPVGILFAFAISGTVLAEQLGSEARGSQRRRAKMPITEGLNEAT